MPRRPDARSLLLLAMLAAMLLGAPGCGDGGAGAMDAGPPDLAPSNALVRARPYQHEIPSGYDPSRPYPLVVLLHGYGANGIVQDAYFGLSRLVDERQFLFAYPDGTLDAQNRRFWNATDACCDFGGIGVDDVAYVTAVIDDMSARYHVDPKRVFVAGHSNGGYMAHRLACERAPRIAAIMALAGVGWKDATRCQPAAPVTVLQVHGDADDTVLYAGTSAYPSARVSTTAWAGKNGCPGATEMGAALDLDTSLAGTETTVERWSGCAPGGAVELWTIRGGAHLPTFGAAWASKLLDFFFAHPRP